MPSTDPNNGKKLKDVMMFFISAVLFIILVNGVGYLLRQKDDLPKQIEPPIVEQPASSSSAASSSPTAKPIEVELLAAPYVPTNNPFGENEYDKAPKILMSGAFSGVTLSINGEVIGEGIRLLLLNFNNDSGIINGYRTAANRIGIQETKDQGGIFTKESPITADVNLMNTKLGSSRSDFEKNGSPVQSFQFIREEQPIDVAKIIVVPFDENGRYRGGIIYSLKISYTCQEGKSCSIASCDSSKKATECIQEAHGNSAMLEWRKRTGI